MTCEELLQALNAYVDGEALPAFCAKYADHLAECNPCQVVIDNICQTITLYRAGSPHPLPVEFQSSLRQELRRRWQERFGPRQPAPSA